MKIRLYNSKNDIVQVLALENGVLIRYVGNREIWCPNADCYLDEDVYKRQGFAGFRLCDRYNDNRSFLNLFPRE